MRWDRGPASWLDSTSRMDSAGARGGGERNPRKQTVPLTATEEGQGFPSSQIHPAGAKMELYHLVLMERGDTELLHCRDSSGMQTCPCA